MQEMTQTGDDSIFVTRRAFVLPRVRVDGWMNATASSRSTAFSSAHTTTDSQSVGRRKSPEHDDALPNEILKSTLSVLNIE